MHLTITVHHEIDRMIDRDAFPIRQNVDGDEISFAGQFGMGQPYMPWLGGRDRHFHFRFDLMHVGDELCRRDVAAKQRFVADQDAIDIVVVAGRGDRMADFFLVAIKPGIDPRPERYAQAVGPRQIRNKIETVERTISAHAVGHAAQHP